MNEKFLDNVVPKSDNILLDYPVFCLHFCVEAINDAWEEEKMVPDRSGKLVPGPTQEMLNMIEMMSKTEITKKELLKSVRSELNKTYSDLPYFQQPGKVGKIGEEGTYMEAILSGYIEPFVVPETKLSLLKALNLPGKYVELKDDPEALQQVVSNLTNAVRCTKTYFEIPESFHKKITTMLLRTIPLFRNAPNLAQDPGFLMKQSTMILEIMGMSNPMNMTPKDLQDIFSVLGYMGMISEDYFGITLPNNPNPFGEISPSVKKLMQEQGIELPNLGSRQRKPTPTSTQQPQSSS